MWQCLKELKTRRESLESIEFEIEDSKDKIELLDILASKLEIQMKECSDTHIEQLTKKELEIKIKQNRRHKKAAESALSELINRKKYIEEEAKFFIESFKSFEKLRFDTRRRCI